MIGTTDESIRFETFGLTPVPATVVKAPLIAECYAGLECKVVQRKYKPRMNTDSRA